MPSWHPPFSADRTPADADAASTPAPDPTRARARAPSAASTAAKIRSPDGSNPSEGFLGAPRMTVPASRMTMTGGEIQGAVRMGGCPGEGKTCEGEGEGGARTE